MTYILPQNPIVFKTTGVRALFDSHRALPGLTPDRAPDPGLRAP